MFHRHSLPPQIIASFALTLLIGLSEALALAPTTVSASPTVSTSTDSIWTRSGAYVHA